MVRRIPTAWNTEAAEAHRMAQIDRWWPFEVKEGKLGRKRKRRIIMIRLPNGDWVPFGPGVKIIHYCKGAECCRDEAHTVEKFVVYVVPAILPYSPVTVSQARWRTQIPRVGSAPWLEARAVQALGGG